MATYVVGDIQGCFLTFQRLLAAIKFDPLVDQLILLGDVINRGPSSLPMLRFVKAHSSSIKMVLGNHEIFAIALALDALKTTRTHTLHDLLAASDGDELINFLRAQPLIRQIGINVFVHAGIMPAMSVDTAHRHAALLSEILMSDDAAPFLKRFYEKTPTTLKPGAGRKRSLRFALASFTLLRMCETPYRMDLAYKGELDKAPAKLTPWFQLRQHGEHAIYFGHWAALGYYRYPGAICLDTGCVWGKTLSAMALEDHKLIQIPCVDPVRTG